jgi:hypothetical protein
MKERIFLAHMDEIGRTALDSICGVDCKNRPSSFLFQSKIPFPAPVTSGLVHEGIY